MPVDTPHIVETIEQVYGTLTPQVWDHIRKVCGGINSYPSEPDNARRTVRPTLQRVVREQAPLSPEAQLELAMRLHSQPFTASFVGIFSAGKSTLLNAFLRHTSQQGMPEGDLLPMGQEATTRRITEIRFDPRLNEDESRHTAEYLSRIDLLRFLQRTLKNDMLESGATFLGEPHLPLGFPQPGDPEGRSVALLGDIERCLRHKWQAGRQTYARDILAVWAAARAALDPEISAALGAESGREIDLDEFKRRLVAPSVLASLAQKGESWEALRDGLGLTEIRNILVKKLIFARGDNMGLADEKDPQEFALQDFPGAGNDALESFLAEEALLEAHLIFVVMRQGKFGSQELMRIIEHFGFHRHGHDLEAVLKRMYFLQVDVGAEGPTLTSPDDVRGYESTVGVLSNSLGYVIAKAPPESRREPERELFVKYLDHFLPMCSRERWRELQGTSVERAEAAEARARVQDGAFDLVSLSEHDRGRVLEHRRVLGRTEEDEGIGELSLYRVAVSDWLKHQDAWDALARCFAHVRNEFGFERLREVLRAHFVDTDALSRLRDDDVRHHLRLACAPLVGLAELSNVEPATATPLEMVSVQNGLARAAHRIKLLRQMLRCWSRRTYSRFPSGEIVPEDAGDRQAVLQALSVARRVEEQLVQVTHEIVESAFSTNCWRTFLTDSTEPIDGSFADWISMRIQGAELPPGLMDDLVEASPRRLICLRNHPFLPYRFYLQQRDQVVLPEFRLRGFAPLLKALPEIAELLVRDPSWELVDDFLGRVSARANAGLAQPMIDAVRKRSQWLLPEEDMDLEKWFRDYFVAESPDKESRQAEHFFHPQARQMGGSIREYVPRDKLPRNGAELEGFLNRVGLLEDDLGGRDREQLMELDRSMVTEILQEIGLLPMNFTDDGDEAEDDGARPAGNNIWTTCPLPQLDGSSSILATNEGTEKGDPSWSPLPFDPYAVQHREEVFLANARRLLRVQLLDAAGAITRGFVHQTWHSFRTRREISLRGEFDRLLETIEYLHLQADDFWGCASRRPRDLEGRPERGGGEGNRSPPRQTRRRATPSPVPAGATLMSLQIVEMSPTSIPAPSGDEVVRVSITLRNVGEDRINISRPAPGTPLHAFCANIEVYPVSLEPQGQLTLDLDIRYGVMDIEPPDLRLALLHRRSSARTARAFWLPIPVKRRTAPAPKNSSEGTRGTRQDDGGSHLVFVVDDLIQERIIRYGQQQTLRTTFKNTAKDRKWVITTIDGLGGGSVFTSRDLREGASVEGYTSFEIFVNCVPGHGALHGEQTLTFTGEWAGSRRRADRALHQRRTHDTAARAEAFSRRTVDRLRQHA